MCTPSFPLQLIHVDSSVAFVASNDFVPRVINEMA